MFENQSLVDMLRLYSCLVGGQEDALLFEDLKREANALEPGCIEADSMTAYDAFLMVEKITRGNAIVPHLEVEGYDDTTMELSKWDFSAPINDRNQYPDDRETSWRELRYKPPVDDVDSPPH